MLELAVLGLLKEKTMHGYEVKKNLDEQLGHFWQFSYGSLYPSLKRLAREEAVVMELPIGETSRRKNVYRITAKGEAMFTELLEASSPDVEDRNAFMLRFAFSRYMLPETRQRLLEGRRGYLQDRLAKMGASMKKLRDRMDAYSMELMKYGVDEAEHDIRWLDGMLESERTQRAAQAQSLPPQPKTLEGTG